MWDTQRRISFLVDFSDYLESNSVTSLAVCEAVETEFKENIFKGTWVKQMQFHLLNEMNRTKEKFYYEEGRSLLRFISNALNHHETLPPHVQEKIGNTKHKTE